MHVERYPMCVGITLQPTLLLIGTNSITNSTTSTSRNSRALPAVDENLPCGRSLARCATGMPSTMEWFTELPNVTPSLWGAMRNDAGFEEYCIDKEEQDLSVLSIKEDMDDCERVLIRKVYKMESRTNPIPIWIRAFTSYENVAFKVEQQWWRDLHGAETPMTTVTNVLTPTLLADRVVVESAQWMTLRVRGGINVHTRMTITVKVTGIGDAIASLLSNRAKANIKMLPQVCAAAASERLVFRLTSAHDHHTRPLRITAHAHCARPLHPPAAHTHCARAPPLRTRASRPPQLLRSYMSTQRGRELLQRTPRSEPLQSTPTPTPTPDTGEGAKPSPALGVGGNAALAGPSTPMLSATAAAAPAAAVAADAVAGIAAAAPAATPTAALASNIATAPAAALSFAPPASPHAVPAAPSAKAAGAAACEIACEIACEVAVSCTGTSGAPVTAASLSGVPHTPVASPPISPPVAAGTLRGVTPSDAAAPPPADAATLPPAEAEAISSSEAVPGGCFPSCRGKRQPSAAPRSRTRTLSLRRLVGALSGGGKRRSRHGPLPMVAVATPPGSSKPSAALALEVGDEMAANSGYSDGPSEAHSSHCAVCASGDSTAAVVATAALTDVGFGGKPEDLAAEGEAPPLTNVIATADVACMMPACGAPVSAQHARAAGIASGVPGASEVEPSSATANAEGASDRGCGASGSGGDGNGGGGGDGSGDGSDDGGGEAVSGMALVVHEESVIDEAMTEPWRAFTEAIALGEAWQSFASTMGRLSESTANGLGEVGAAIATPVKGMGGSIGGLASAAGQSVGDLAEATCELGSAITTGSVRGIGQLTGNTVDAVDRLFEGLGAAVWIAEDGAKDKEDAGGSEGARGGTPSASVSAATEEAPPVSVAAVAAATATATVPEAVAVGEVAAGEAAGGDGAEVMADAAPASPANVAPAAAANQASHSEQQASDDVVVV